MTLTRFIFVATLLSIVLSAVNSLLLPLFSSTQLIGRRAILGSPLLIPSLIPSTITYTIAPSELIYPGAENGKSVLITGASSGIGYDATLRFLKDGYRVFVSARNNDKAKILEERIRSSFSPPLSTSQLNCDICDLSSLTSIQTYVKSLKSNPTLLRNGLDLVCLNAGLSHNIKDFTPKRTSEGFEETVGVNHLGHFAMVEYGVNGMVSSNGGGRVVVTASGVHDPDSPGGKQGSKATLGNLEGFISKGREFDMVDGGVYDPDKAYKDSKLCNVFFAREYQERLRRDGVGNVIVNSFTPGLIVGTGLFRDQNPLFTKVFDVAATDVFKVGETVEWGGGALHYMATSGDINEGGLYYGAKPGASKYGDKAYGTYFNVDQVSREVREGEEVQRKLWELSKKLVS